MEQYIPKSAVVAEIESLLDKGRYHEEYDCAYRDGNNGALYALKSKLDTIEVKEVSLEKHLKEDIEDTLFDLNGVAVIGATHYLTVDDVKEIAKHFFELGMAVSNEAQKGE